MVSSFRKVNQSRKRGARANAITDTAKAGLAREERRVEERDDRAREATGAKTLQRCEHFRRVISAAAADFWTVAPRLKLDLPGADPDGADVPERLAGLVGEAMLAASAAESAKPAPPEKGAAEGRAVRAAAAADVAGAKLVGALAAAASRHRWDSAVGGDEELRIVGRRRLKDVSKSTTITPPSFQSWTPTDISDKTNPPIFFKRCWVFFPLSLSLSLSPKKTHNK